MKTTIALCCLLIAAAPLAFAQDISAKRPKNPPTYKSKEDADKHKAHMEQVSVCSSRARQRKLKEGTPEWSNLMSGCMRENNTPSAKR
jgi:hypothetical protein